MRTSRFVIYIAVATSLALVYVHQQIELIKLSYSIDSKECRLKDMLDHRESLSYNIENLESPARLEKVLLAHKIDISFPKRSQLVQAKQAVPAHTGSKGLRIAGLRRKIDISGIVDFFTPSAEAQAK